MKEYRKIVTFTYKKNKYNLYLDSNGKRFFLRVDDVGNLNYISSEELCELLNLFIKNKEVKMINLEKTGLIPKILTGAGAVLLTSTLLMQFLPRGSKAPEINDVSWSISEDDVKKYISTYDENEVSENYYYDSDFNCLYIYNNDYIDNVMDVDSVSLQDFKEVIDNNSGISGIYKDLLYEYCERVVSVYPNADLRVLYKNLQTLQIEECNQNEMYEATSSVYCKGFYNTNKNKICVLEDNNYEKGSDEYQILFHELSHALRNCSFELDDVDVRIQIENNFDNDITEEALDTLFAVSLLDYEENEYGYQLQSNYYSILTECVDYDFTNYVNKPLSDFPNKLNEYNGDEKGTAESVLELIKIQYDAHHNSDIEVDNDEFNPIIDYLCDMYFNKYITDDMSYEEARIIAENLEEKIIRNTRGNYEIDVNRIYENLDNYYNYDMNISLKSL